MESGQNLINKAIKDSIFNLIKDNEQGISCTQLSKKLKLNRITLSKYLSVLHSEGYVDYKDFGMAKAWYINKNPQILNYFNENNGHTIKNILNILGDGVIVVDRDNKILWANSYVNTMIKADKELSGEKFNDLFMEIENCLQNPNCESFHKRTTYQYINDKNQTLKATISPILNSKNDKIGYIHLLKTD